MRMLKLAQVAVCMGMGISALIPAAAQTDMVPSSDGMAESTSQSSMTAPVPSRVLGHVDDSQLVTLKGNTHPMAQLPFDKGQLEAGRQLERILLVLQRSPEQEKSLAEFNERQTDPKSPDYHHWLHADEFGRLYGPSDSDMTAVTSWLQTHGFAIDEVSKGRTTIQFSGTVQQVEEAFHVEMHKYLVNGVQHIANDRDPQVPEALAPVIAGVASLHDFFPKPQSVYGNYVKKDLKTGKFTVVGPAHPELKGEKTLGNSERMRSKNGPAPQLTYTPTGDTYPHEEMTPYDFATVYNILPSWNAKVLGTGVSIAISGVSDIAASDVAAFRKTFGLSQYSGTFKTVVNGADPGADGGGGQGENTLDVEMAGATAPDANVILVVSKNSSTTGGDELSDEYIIDNEIAPIMTASYGSCELNLGAANNAAFNKIWQQGATEGISIFESSGDQGSAGCSNSDQAGPNADQVGLQVNGIASSPYLTAVGGTDFTWSFVTGGPAKYWNTTNGAYGQNAKGYMPEVPWNSTCTNPLVYPVFQNGYTSPENFCNGLIGTDYDGLIVITGGSGGESHCTTGGTTNASCTGGWPKPSWQSGLGVPNDGHRDLPDVSLFASAGFADGVVGSAILDCEASNSGDKTCDYTNPDYIIYQEIGGTSASSPLMAGIMALVLQKTGAKQGLANPEFYKLYAGQVAAGTACDSSTVTNASKCVFNDISSGTNAQVCYAGYSDCVTKISGDGLGILSGYATTKGYDQAVGLGSVNVYNLVNAWPSATSEPAVIVSPTSLTFPSTIAGKASATQAVTVKNTGTALLTFTGLSFAGADPKAFIVPAKTCGSSLAAGSSCTVSVEFTPTVAGAMSASMSFSDNASGSPQVVTLQGTATAASTLTTVVVSPTSLTFPSTIVGKASATQAVTVKNTGTALLTFTGLSFAGADPKAFIVPAKTCGSSLAAGASCTVSVEFTPTVAGAMSASMSFSDNANGSPQVVSLQGTATAASTLTSVVVSPTSLTFPSTIVGKASATQAVTVKNTGTALLTFTGLSFAGADPKAFIVPAKTCGSSLAAGASCTVSVEFTPAVAGAMSASMSFSDNASGSPQVVTLQGTATAASTLTTVVVSPTSLTFPATVAGKASATQAVTVKNTGTTLLTFTGLSFAGADPKAFIVPAKTCGSTLAAGASCTVSVEFTPAVAGAMSASMSFSDNANGSPQVVSLSGTATGTSQAASVSLSPTSVSFPNTIIGTASDAQIVTLTNTGATAVNVSSIAVSGAGFLTLNDCAASLAAKASCSIYVAFKPAAAGGVSGTLSVADTASGSPQKVALTATGTAAPSVKLSLTSIAFPATAHGTTSEAVAVTLSNGGTSTLNLTSITLNGANPTAFEALDTCGATLAAGANCTVYLAFKPTAAAAYTATLSIADNGAASPQSVALTGTGK